MRPFASRKSFTSFTGTAKPGSGAGGVARELHPHDAHHVAVLVEHRPAAVAGLDRGVRLQEARLASVVLARRRERAGRDAHLRDHVGVGALRHLGLAAERKAQHLDRPPRLGRVRVAERQVRQVGRRHLQRARSRSGSEATTCASQAPPLPPLPDEHLHPLVLDRELRPVLARAGLDLDDVQARQHEARRRDHEAAAAADRDVLAHHRQPRVVVVDRRSPTTRMKAIASRERGAVGRRRQPRPSASSSAASELRHARP